jgi:hypothetical protein
MRCWRCLGCNPFNKTGTFWLENQLRRGQSLLDGSCVDSFAAGLSILLYSFEKGVY